MVAEDEGGPGPQLVALSSFTGADREGRLDLSRISHVFVVAGPGTYLMFAGDVGNILMASFITELR